MIHGRLGDIDFGFEYFATIDEPKRMQLIMMEKSLAKGMLIVDKSHACGTYESISIAIPT